MTAPAIIVITFLISLGAMTSCWLYGLFHGHDLSLADGYYGLGSLVHAAITYALWPHRSGRGFALLIIAGLWSAGLAQALFRRWLTSRATGGDPRYRDASHRLGLEGAGYWWKSFFVLIASQALLISFLNLPLQLAIMTRRPAFGSRLDIIGLATIAFGGAMEVLANTQLEA
jgi:steroid 5-alpha reductase family enzyme